jgi:LysW-gamma-L-lysine/LysW-L-ornithine aminotransferase
MTDYLKQTTSKNSREIEDLYEIDLYGKRELEIAYGNGASVFDANNKRYIDLVGGIAVASVGHANPYVIEAISNQAAKIITVPELFYNSTRAEFLQLLHKNLPTELNRTFLCNSGTEAVEAAIKFAKYTARTQRNITKPHFISIMRGFHGRTHGSLSLTFDKKYREPFYPLPGEVSFVPQNNIEKLQNTLQDNSIAIIIEIVQGEGGVHMIAKDYLEYIRSVCDERNIILIIDEIQTGFGRTGKMFAFEHYKILPDILCLAKAMGGGVPIGATIINDKIKIERKLHGSTFGGNPLACAAGLAVLRYLGEYNLVNETKEKGEYFLNELRKINSPLIREIRGIGLIIGIELKERVYSFINELMDKGVLVMSSGSTVLRLLPPLVITYDEIDKVIQILSEVLNK